MSVHARPLFALSCFVPPPHVSEGAREGWRPRRGCSVGRRLHRHRYSEAVGSFLRNNRINGVSYQWYTGTAGTTTNPISGATGASLTVQPASTTSYCVRTTGVPRYLVTFVTAADALNCCGSTHAGHVDIHPRPESSAAATTSQVASGLNASSAHTVSAPGSASQRCLLCQ
jgi:hypothetical protein